MKVEMEMDAVKRMLANVYESGFKAGTALGNDDGIQSPMERIDRSIMEDYISSIYGHLYQLAESQQKKKELSSG